MSLIEKAAERLEKLKQAGAVPSAEPVVAAPAPAPVAAAPAAQATAPQSAAPTPSSAPAAEAAPSAEIVRLTPPFEKGCPCVQAPRFLPSGSS